MCREERKTAMKEFVTSQFGYCPLVWMFHNRSLNNKINYLDKRALRITTYGDRSSSFEDLLKKENSASIHQRY